MSKFYEVAEVFEHRAEATRRIAEGDAVNVQSCIAAGQPGLADRYQQARVLGERLAQVLFAIAAEASALAEQEENDQGGCRSE